MNVLFTSLYPMWDYHYVSELNLLQEHLEAGDGVSMTTCDASLGNCECNPTHELPHCLRCVSIRNRGLSLIQGEVTTLPLVDKAFAKASPRGGVPDFASVDELKAYRWEGFDLGMAVYSSLVDRLSSSVPDVVAHRALVRSLFLDAWRVWMSARSLLAKHHFDRVYLFNGRYASARPWIRACEQAGVEYFTHEKSGDPEKIFLFHNQFPHEPLQYAAMIESFWRKSNGDDVVLQEGREFFEERPRGQLSGWTSFVTQQHKEMLPESWDPGRRNIAIFASTEHEIVGLSDLFAEGLFPDQFAAYRRIVGDIAVRDPSVFFYLRIHPNSGKESVKWWESPSLREAGNLEVISPESPVSSYALMAACEKCIAFMSSAGIEATYWGKPSMVLGTAYYAGIGAVFEPKSPWEALEWILGSPSPQPALNAVKYGAFMRCGGSQLPHSKMVNYYTLSFRGEVLEAGEEVHHWMSECKARPPVSGWKQWLRNRADAIRFRKMLARFSRRQAQASSPA